MKSPWFLAVPVLAAALAGCGGAVDAEAVEVVASAVPRAPEVRVEVATIQPSEARLDLEIPGEVSGFHDALLAAPAGGIVERLLVGEGDEVRKGQTLVRVNAALYGAQRDQAAAQAAQAEADLGRVQALGDLATAAQLQAAETQVKISAAALKLSEINLSRSVLSAPFDGVVAQVAVEEGEMAQPGSPLVRVVQLDPIKVALSVADRDIGSLKPGMEVGVLVDAYAEPHPGKLVQISPAADLKTRSFLAEVSVPNADRHLLPGMIATARVSETIATDAVVIPQDWLVTSLGGVGVFVEEGGVARWRPVHVSSVVRDQIIVASGIAAGDRVVSTGHRELADGDPLLVDREGVCCTLGRAVFAD